MASKCVPAKDWKAEARAKIKGRLKALDPWIHPLEIDHHNTADDIGYMSRGHHRADAFMAAVAKFDPTAKELVLGDPRQVWLKVVPRPEYLCMRHEVKEGTRGAFPATVTQESSLYDQYIWPESQENKNG